MEMGKSGWGLELSHSLQQYGQVTVTGLIILYILLNKMFYKVYTTHTWSRRVTDQSATVLQFYQAEASMIMTDDSLQETPTDLLLFLSLLTCKFYIKSNVSILLYNQ